MKCIDEKYHSLPHYYAIDSLSFKEFECIPTKTDYTLVNVGCNLELFNHYDDIVYMHFEEPNCFWVPAQEQRIRDNYHKIKKLISTCPYSVEYYNNLYNDDRRMYGFHPFNIKNIPTDFTKKYDVFFTGHVMSDFISNNVKSVEKFNHCIVSNNYGNFKGVSYKEKLRLNANSKISVVHNCLINHHNMSLEKVFKNIKNPMFIPQPKTRSLEAAACRSVMLCHFEEFRCIEWYFEPDKDFIYWYNNDDLEEKINEILKNYDKYTYLTDNAFNKLVNNWTTHHFFDKYLKNL
jgi:Txe/YoeB family toxin of Txe-Axe toxin-antitoxin module